MQRLHKQRKKQSWEIITKANINRSDQGREVAREKVEPKREHGERVAGARIFRALPIWESREYLLKTQYKQHLPGATPLCLTKTSGRADCLMIH